MKKSIYTKWFSFIIIFVTACTTFLFGCSSPPDYTIHPISASGVSSDANHSASKCIDNDNSTFYESPEPNKDESILRNVDITFDGIYLVHYINIKQAVGKYLDTYNHYEIYATYDGTNFSKIAYKSNDNIALVAGDDYSFDNPIYAYQIRINLSFNSWWDATATDGVSGMQCPLAETIFKGHRVGEPPQYNNNVNISNFDQTSYGDFHRRFNESTSFKDDKIRNQLHSLVIEVLGSEYLPYFDFYLSDANKDNYTITKSGSHIEITANNGISLASGFNYYIKNYLHVDYNPLFSTNPINQNLFPPSNLPNPGTITQEAHYDYRYALNYCTYSYTMSFWGWTEWEKFLNWAAMNGINLMLDIVGQEEALRETLTQFNYSDAEARSYIAGPAYQAWFMMGNMTGLGGPLSTQWFEQRVELARQIHQRMEIYGITPILQGWCGSVPDDFAIKNPGTQLFHSNSWCGFNHKQYLIDSQPGPNHSKDLFDNFYSKYYDHQIDLFGNISDWRSADPFHERSYQGLGKGSNESHAIYLSILNEMQLKNPNFKWLMQQWQGSIEQSDLQAIKNAGFNNHLMVLDLYADVEPNHERMELTQTPWIWTMINNFGGRMGIYGYPEHLMALPIQNSTSDTVYMKGIGVAPESFGNSPMLYEELFDVNWMPDTRQSTKQYVNKYLESAYGFNDANTNADVGAWSYMLNTAYNSTRTRNAFQGAPESVFNARPQNNVTHVSTWGGTDLGYDANEFANALPKFISAYKGSNDSDNSPNFIYDMADVTRQCVQNKAKELLQAMKGIYDTTDAGLANFKWTIYQSLSIVFMQLLDLQNAILTKTPTFNIATWINQSRNSVMNNMDDWTKDQMELNARMLVTTWGTPKIANPGQLNDYSNRQWAGLTGTLYKERWQRFFENTIMNKSEYQTSQWFQYEWEWANRKSDEGYSFDSTPDARSLKVLAQEVNNLII